MHSDPVSPLPKPLQDQIQTTARRQKGLPHLALTYLPSLSPLLTPQGHGRSSCSNVQLQLSASIFPPLTLWLKCRPLRSHLPGSPCSLAMANIPFLTFTEPFVIIHAIPRLSWEPCLCIPIMPCTSLSAYLPHCLYWLVLRSPTAHLMQHSLSIYSFLNPLFFAFNGNPGHSEFIWTESK